MQRERTLLQKLYLFLKGLAMGSANKVPGVSGGTVSFVLGFYKLGKEWILRLAIPFESRN